MGPKQDYEEVAPIRNRINTQDTRAKCVFVWVCVCVCMCVWEREREREREESGGEIFCTCIVYDTAHKRIFMVENENIDLR